MEKLNFSVDSALLSELGEKLVEHVHVALVELVKNAYDADATQVTVKIVPQVGKGPEVHVIDDGTGMTFDEVERYWMRIATTHKVNDDTSARYGRPRTGSKGIGRFSCRRLGSELHVITTAQLSAQRYERTEVHFDWSRFTPGLELTEITCAGERKQSKQGQSGTSLIISNAAADEWDRRGYHYLKRQLAVLTANRGTKRKGYEEDPGFTLRLEAPGFDEPIVDLRERLIAAGWGDVTLDVDDKGRATCRLSAMRVRPQPVTFPKSVPNLAGVKAHIGILVLDQKQLRDKKVLSLGTLKDIMVDWGGVNIRYNGFRVYPFGQMGDDWLHIDLDRARRKPGGSELLKPFAAKLAGIDPSRALLQLLSSRNYVGDVEIDTRASGFEMKASREGFVGDRALSQLRELVRFAIDWATLYRDYYLRLMDREEAEEARKTFEQELGRNVETERVVEHAVRVVQTEVKSLASPLPAPQRQIIVRSVRTATDAILKRDRANQDELRHLRLVASTSTLLLIFSHEVKTVLSSLEEMSSGLARAEKHLSGAESQRIREMREGLAETKRRFVDLLQMTSLISADSRKSKPEPLALRARVEKAIACYQLITRSYGIDIDCSAVPRNQLVRGLLQAELYAVLLNALSNAIKSVIARGKPREIEIAFEKNGGQASLHIRDTGIGLKPERFEEVFVPFVSDPDGHLYQGLKGHLNPEDNYIVGTGSGLGLSILREILVTRGGGATFVRPTGKWKADLELVLP